MQLDVMASYLSKRDYRLVKIALKHIIEAPNKIKLSESDWGRLNDILATMTD